MNIYEHSNQLKKNILKWTTARFDLSEPKSSHHDLPIKYHVFNASFFPKYQDIIIYHDMIFCKKIWHDPSCHDMIWYDVMWYMILYMRYRIWYMTYDDKRELLVKHWYISYHSIIRCIPIAQAGKERMSQNHLWWAVESALNVPGEDFSSQSATKTGIEWLWNEDWFDVSCVYIYIWMNTCLKYTHIRLYVYIHTQ